MVGTNFVGLIIIQKMQLNLTRITSLQTAVFCTLNCVSVQQRMVTMCDHHKVTDTYMEFQNLTIRNGMLPSFFLQRPSTLIGAVVETLWTVAAYVC